MSYKEQRREALLKQGNQTAVMRMPASGEEDLEFHHTKGRENSEGVTVTVPEHLFLHLVEFYRDPKSAKGQEAFDTVMGRLNELDDDGKFVLKELIRKKLGIRVSFI